LGNSTFQRKIPKAGHWEFHIPEEDSKGGPLGIPHSRGRFQRRATGNSTFQRKIPKAGHWEFHIPEEDS
jgi:hypothetical protein